jgi:mRNA interferase MazF
MSVRRGEIYWLDFEPVKGSEQGGLRPALVIQNDIGNRYSPTTIVAAITRTIPQENYPFLVIIEPEDSGLPERGVVNCAQIVTVQQAGLNSRLRPPRGQTVLRPIGRLDGQKMAEVNVALRYNLSLEED